MHFEEKLVDAKVLQLQKHSCSKFHTHSFRVCDNSSGMCQVQSHEEGEPFKNWANNADVKQ